MFMTFYVAFSIGFTKWLCCICWPFSNRLFTGQLKKSPSLSLTVRKKRRLIIKMSHLPCAKIL